MEERYFGDLKFDERTVLLFISDDHVLFRIHPF